MDIHAKGNESSVIFKDHKEGDPQVVRRTTGAEAYRNYTFSVSKYGDSFDGEVREVAVMSKVDYRRVIEFMIDSFRGQMTSSDRQELERKHQVLVEATKQRFSRYVACVVPEEVDQFTHYIEERWDGKEDGNRQKNVIGSQPLPPEPPESAKANINIAA